MPKNINNSGNSSIDIDYSKITLCPVLEYKCYCQVGGKCEHCPHYHTNTGEKCKGCGANFKNKPNLKAKFCEK